MSDTPSKLQKEEVLFQQTYDYTWEANLEQNLANAKSELIELRGNGDIDCPARLSAKIISLISQMRFFLKKYNRDTEAYDQCMLRLRMTDSVDVFDAELSAIEEKFAQEAGYVLNFRAKTDKKEDWENF